jgi:hypothetical protein
MSGIVWNRSVGRLTLYRRVGRRLSLWREIDGDEATLDRALESALELDVLAQELGGWENALQLGLQPAAPGASS